MAGESSQVELGERVGVEGPTLAGILARMERDCWLERYSCPNDGRCKRIFATGKAEAVWNRMADCSRRVRKRAVAGSSENDLAALKQVCATIRDNL